MLNAGSNKKAYILLTGFVMNRLIYAVAFLFPLISFGQVEGSRSNEFYKSASYMIIQTTQVRIQSLAQNDYAKVCKVVQGPAPIDTMAYYLSFEIFDDSNLSALFFEEIGSFVARNYESMYRKNLPRALHFACLEGSKSKIREVIEQIRDIYILE